MNAKLTALLLTLAAVLGLADAAPAGAASFPPAASGCGTSGPSRRKQKPTVRLPATWTLRATGKLHGVTTGANQVAAATVSIVQAGGRHIGGTDTGHYTCVAPSSGATSLTISSYGRALVRRHRTLSVTVTYRLTNGAGVMNAVHRSAVINAS